MDLRRFPGDAGDCPAAQATGRPGVSLDAVAQLDRLGRRRHAADRRRGVEVVAEQPGVQPFPAASLVAHPHDVGDEHVVVDLGVARPGRPHGGTPPR